MAGKAVDLTGQRFGRLVVMERAPKNPRYATAYTLWNCRCDCGEETIVRSHSLIQGETKSCGCLRVENINRQRERKRRNKT